MKPVLLTVALLFALTACDAPQRVRTSGTTYDSNVSTGSTSNFTSSGTSTTTTTTTTTGSTTGTTTTTTSINCIKTVTAYHSGLGNVDVCEDSSSETYFKLTFSTTDQSDGTCVVPMYKDSSGNSTYLGSAQCTKHNSGDVQYGYLNKNRTGYTGYQINSVMVLKYSGTTAFFQCMNAYGSYYQSCMSSYLNSAYYQTYCNSQATTYMTNMCNTFKSNYPYSQVSTR